MPATYAHYRFGLAVLERLPEAQRSVIASESDLFMIGLHGPDILFFYHPLLPVNRVIRLGRQLHRAPGLPFFRRAAEHCNNDAALSYAYGCLCHFALDQACHGYIAEKMAESKLSHAEIETEFDRSLLVEDGADPVRQSITEHLRSSRRSAEVIAPFYDGLTPRKAQAAVDGFLFFHRLLLAPGKLKRGLIFACLGVVGLYQRLHGLVVNYKPNPLCADSCNILRAQFEGAVGNAVELIQSFPEDLSNDLYHYTFGSKYQPELS